MRTKGINLENVKTSNRATLLSMLNKSGAMSRKDLAAEMGLTAATITLICNELLEEGIILELGEADQTERRAGRKKILVDINHDYKKVLCISIEADETYITLTDIGGKVIGEERLDTDKEQAPEEFLKEIASICRDTVLKANVDREDILAVGVTVPGKIDREKGVAVNTYNVWNHPVEIKQILQAELGFNVIVENNVRAYAESELIYGNGRQQDHMLIVKWGPGVGSAIIIDGKIYQGANNQAAELGHTIVYKNGELCSCGKRGCLETGISTHAICAEVDKAMAAGQMTTLNSWLKANNMTTSSDINKWAAVEDAKLQELLDEKMDVLAFSVGNIACMLNPSKIIVYGYIFEIDGILERFKDKYAKLTSNFADDYVIRSELQDRAYYSGPLAIVMNELIFRQ